MEFSIIFFIFLNEGFPKQFLSILTYCWNILVYLDLNHSNHRKTRQKGRCPTGGLQLCPAEVEILPVEDMLIHSLD